MLCVRQPGAKSLPISKHTTHHPNEKSPWSDLRSNNYQLRIFSARKQLMKERQVGTTLVDAKTECFDRCWKLLEILARKLLENADVHAQGSIHERVKIKRCRNGLGLGMHGSHKRWITKAVQMGEVNRCVEGRERTNNQV